MEAEPNNNVNTSLDKEKLAAILLFPRKNPNANGLTLLFVLKLVMRLVLLMEKGGFAETPENVRTLLRDIFVDGRVVI